jgi:hypothetical protein
MADPSRNPRVRGDPAQGMDRRDPDRASRQDLGDPGRARLAPLGPLDKNSAMSFRAAVLAGAVASLALSLAVRHPTAAQTTAAPLVLRYSFQPECLRKSAGAPCDTPRASKRLDLGPQIAVWLERGDGSFVDTLLVTNATAVRGIGNRPGYWRFPSNWHFPYGKRKMALPVWAHARGKTYDTLVIQDDDGMNDEEQALGFHESVSTPDPYYCLTFKPATWVFDVDAISCPTAMFNSAKGRLDPKQPKSYYPPRGDLTSFGPADCDMPSVSADACKNTSATHFGELNDLDAVASATPPYNDIFSGTWPIPADLPEGPYLLAVEVNKEFDNNPAHMHEAFRDPALPENGLRNNIGQPSVVWKVPFQLERAGRAQAAVTDITGYGDWDGETGTLHAPDSTISDGLGTGVGRLKVIARPALAGGMPVMGRVHVTTETPLTPDQCAMLPPDNGRVNGLAVAEVTDHDAHLDFTEAQDRGQAVEEYEIRYRVGDSMTLEQFLEATPAPMVVPRGPGLRLSVTLPELKPSFTYTVGVRARGGCVKDGPLSQLTFTTPALKFKQLSGCFVATAAYGSPLEPQVAALRRLRDRARASSGFAAVSVGLYERASPPVAALLRQTEIGRALVRAALSPIVGAAQAAE